MAHNSLVDIAVVIPTYNRGRLVRRAVESVLGQTRRPAEVIVVDDGSTDDTREQLATLGGAVRAIHQRNAGASEARNRGVAEARSDWVAFLDSDDVWLPSHLGRLAAAIERTGGGAVLYFCDMEMEEREGGRRLWETCGFRAAGDVAVVEDATDWVMMERQPMMLQTGVFRRSAYLEAGGLWPRLRTRHDTHFFIKLGAGRPMCAVAGIGTRQTSDDDPANRLMSASGPGSARFWEESVPMYEDLLAALPGLPAHHRATVRRRLAEAHWRLARIAMKEGRLGASLVKAVRSAAADPAAVSAAFARALRPARHARGG